MSISNITTKIHYSIRRDPVPFNWIIHPRTIPDNEIVLITGGEGKIVAEGKEYAAKCGELFYFYPGLVHSLSSSNTNPLKLLALHFVFAKVDYINNNWTINKSSQPLPWPVCIKSNSFLQIKDLMVEIVTLRNQEDFDRELLCNSMLLKLIYCINDSLNTKTYDYTSKMRTEKMMAYILSNINRKLLVDEVCKQTGLSTDYANLIFKKYSGKSIGKYITHCKMQKAKQFLAEKNLSIADVAKQLGYGDEFYFSRVFKKTEGISPSEFSEKVL